MVKPVIFVISLLFISSFHFVNGWVWPSTTTNPDLCKPDQVHLNLGDAYYNTLNNETMKNAASNTNATAVITWQTQVECKDNYLSIKSEAEKFESEIPFEKLSVEKIDQTVDGPQNKPDLKEGRYQSVSYTAYIKDLKPGVTYTYRIVQKTGVNSAGPFDFKLPSLTPTSDQLKFVVYADMDTLLTNKTVESLEKMYRNPSTRFDFQVFAGDMAYDIYSESGIRGEYFYNGMQYLHAQAPFMVNPGNHEWYKNYTFLNFRTKMPLYEKSKNHYYSFNVGKIHFISINYYLFDNENEEIQKRMIDWLDADLVAANQNRKERPWIIVFTHQPLYCSMNDPTERENHRCYWFSQKNVMYDRIYSHHKVDIVLQGHIHYYERTGPVAKNQSVKYYSWSEAQKKNYILNPEAPIYTIEGSAGNKYYMETTPTPLMEYSIMSNTTVGYTAITLLNETAIYYEHINAENGNKIDSFYLLKGDEYKGVPIYPGQPKKPSSPLIWVLIGGILFFVIALAYLISRRFTKRVDNLRHNLMESQARETEIYGI